MKGLAVGFIIIMSVTFLFFFGSFLLPIWTGSLASLFLFLPAALGAITAVVLGVILAIKVNKMERRATVNFFTCLVILTLGVILTAFYQHPHTTWTRDLQVTGIVDVVGGAVATIVCGYILSIKALKFRPIEPQDHNKLSS
jgi:hypothetical protein